MHRLHAAVLALLVLGVPGYSSAQTTPAQSSVSGAIGAVNFDVNGVATTVGVSGRAAAALTSNVTVEGNVAWVENDTQVASTKMWVAEAHVHYNWRSGRLRPYAGGGGGLFVNRGDFGSNSDLTLSAAGGLRVDLTDRVSALGEFRIRGVDFDVTGFSFSGSLAEIWGGVTVRLGR